MMIDLTAAEIDALIHASGYCGAVHQTNNWPAPYYATDLAIAIQKLQTLVDTEDEPA